MIPLCFLELEIMLMALFLASTLLSLLKLTNRLLVDSLFPSSGLRSLSCPYQPEKLQVFFWRMCNEICVYGRMIEFAKNLANFAAASGKKHVVLLSSLDFGKWQKIDMLSGLQLYYLSNTNPDGRDDNCEQLGWKRLQEYNPALRCWKYLSTLAERNTMLESNLPFEDELEDEDYYPSLPFAALFSCLKAKGLKVTCLLCYCSEGDNIQDAFHLAEAACGLLGLNPSTFHGEFPLYFFLLKVFFILKISIFPATVTL
ncbi:hypothetical protein REPUB_Repub01dG0252400 [Reevesia pubescens]